MKVVRDGYLVLMTSDDEDDENAVSKIHEVRKYRRAIRNGLSNIQWECLQWLAQGYPVLRTEDSPTPWLGNTLKSLENRGYIEFDDALDDYKITATGQLALEILLND